MNRYPLILLIALVVCLPFLMADDEFTPPWWTGSQYQHIREYVQPQDATESLAHIEGRYEQMLSSAMAGYGNQVNQFGATYVNNYSSEAYSGLVSSVNGYVNEYSASRATEFDINTMNSVVNQYISTATSYCAPLTNAINQNTSYGNIAGVKQSYAENVKDIVQYFMEDVKNRNLFSMTDYEKDFQLVQKYVNDRLTRETMTAGKRHKFIPLDHVDSGVPGETRDRIEVKIEHAGVNNQYVNKTINYLVNKVNDEFGQPAQLDNEVDWYSANWNNEMNVTLSQVNTRVNDLYSVSLNDSRESRVDLTMNVNEYGHLTEEGLKENVDLNASPRPLLDGLYNNRRYGYRDGKYNTVSVTVGGRKYQLYDQFYTSPLVLDLDGDGKLEASKGEWQPHNYDNSKLVEFDIDGDQFQELTEWVGANDGLLLVGYEKGKEVNANYMFGEAGGYKNGFEKLSLFDTNGDKKIGGDELKTLSVWQDRNGNAKVDDGEVTAITDLGITEISLTYEQLVSSFVQKGETKKMWDWYPSFFRIKKTR